MPERIQRRRVKGWRLPPGAICVTRPGRWGNPFVVREGTPVPPMPAPMWGVWHNGRRLARWDTREMAVADAVDRHRLWLREHPELVALARRELSGRDLACWCPPGTPCHGANWLAVANPAGYHRERRKPAPTGLQHI